MTEEKANAANDETAAATAAAPDAATAANADSAASAKQASGATSATDAIGTTSAASDAAPADATTASAKPKIKKKHMIVGGVVGVIVVLACAFWVWHEQPSFCNSICHSPMDSYVESFSSNNQGMLATVHSQAGKNCLSCHEAKITDQVSEAMKWVADDYPMTADGKMLATGKSFASEQFCARSGCHNMNDVVASTWGFAGNDAKFNPHSSHQDLALDCGDCHKAHSTSVLMCNECHKLNLPEGWENPNEN